MIQSFSSARGREEGGPPGELGRQREGARRGLERNPCRPWNRKEAEPCQKLHRNSSSFLFSDTLGLQRRKIYNLSERPLSNSFTGEMPVN